MSRLNTTMLLILFGLFLPLGAWSQGEVPAPTLQKSLLWWFYQGGWIMYPLLFLSILGFAITLERYNALKKKKLMPKGFLREIEVLWTKGNFSEVQEVCDRISNPLTRIIKNTLGYEGLTQENLEAVLERNGQLQAQFLMRNLRSLGAIASLAPMLGLLGTVIGMIRAFSVVAEGDPNLVSQAIAQALITTAVGLVIGILALVFYHYFRSKAERTALEMESFVMQLFSSKKPF